MPQRLPLLVPLLALGLAVTPAHAQNGGPENPPSLDSPEARISVIGMGEASAAPDLALVDFTVLRAAETASAALDAANQAMAEVIAALKEAGIEDRDLQTSGFSIQPRYQYFNPTDGPQREPEIIGYEVRNSLSVRVRDLTEIGAILDQAVRLGVNQGGSITFSVSDADALEAEARRAAVEDAREKATTLAEAAGVSLGSVISIAEERSAPDPIPMQESMRMMAADASSSVPIEIGESTIRASVRMMFAIGQQ